MLFCATGGAHAATLRPVTQLAGPIVKLSDLFDDAGPQAGRALGPGPGPGQSLTIEAPQLAAIARQFGVTWRPASIADHTLLQRPGVLLPRAAVLAALRAALDGAGAGPGELDLPDFSAPTVAPDAQARADVEQIDFDAGSGRFTAGIAVTGTGMEPLHLRVSGRLEVMQDVLLATRLLEPGVPLQAGDLRPGRVRASLLRGEPVGSAAQAEGLAPRRPLAAGQPVLLAELVKALAVTRGSRIAVALDQPGLSLSAIGIAEEDGALGDRIRVGNPVSHAELLAEVVAAGRVRVEPGSLPLRTADESGRTSPPRLLLP